ncbi:DUF4402 domain-containing protein [Sphingomonas sp.]|uniref:DUF4402 domain-containing protein n=1 Tax=Sphingomonas sp. TaxID=28214 RepID=UPI00286D92CA|nr:DUF4402 domain-containing protein [Sphingomonas sp.]
MTVRDAILMLCLSAAPLAPAAAQCRLCATPSVERAGPGSPNAIQLEIETSLDFDRLVVLAPGQGSATLSPDGSRTVSGTIGAIGGRAMVGTAIVRGEPGRAIRIDLPRRIELFSISGGRIVIEAVASDLPPLPRLDKTGALAFRFGGRLEVSGDAEGDYRGDIPITVDYL